MLKDLWLVLCPYYLFRLPYQYMLCYVFTPLQITLSTGMSSLYSLYPSQSGFLLIQPDLIFVTASHCGKFGTLVLLCLYALSLLHLYLLASYLSHVSNIISSDQSCMLPLSSFPVSYYDFKGFSLPYSPVPPLSSLSAIFLHFFSQVIPQL